MTAAEKTQKCLSKFWSIIKQKPLVMKSKLFILLKFNDFALKRKGLVDDKTLKAFCMFPPVI